MDPDRILLDLREKMTMHSLSSHPRRLEQVSRVFDLQKVNHDSYSQSCSIRMLLFVFVMAVSRQIRGSRGASHLHMDFEVRYRSIGIQIFLFVVSAISCDYRRAALFTSLRV